MAYRRKLGDEQSEDFGGVLDPELTQNISIMFFTLLVLLKFRTGNVKKGPHMNGCIEQVQKDLEWEWGLGVR